MHIIVVFICTLSSSWNAVCEYCLHEVHLAVIGTGDWTIL